MNDLQYLLRDLRKLIEKYDPQPTEVVPRKGRVPFGFELVNDQLQPHRDEQETLARIFQLHRDGFSQLAIVAKLNAEGRKARGRHNEPSTWSQSMISRILRRPR